MQLHAAAETTTRTHHSPIVLTGPRVCQLRARERPRCHTSCGLQQRVGCARCSCTVGVAGYRPLVHKMHIEHGKLEREPSQPCGPASRLNRSHRRNGVPLQLWICASKGRLYRIACRQAATNGNRNSAGIHAHARERRTQTCSSTARRR